MKNITLLFYCIVNLLTCYAQENISIIPQPVKLTQNAGHFVLPSNIAISADKNPELKQAITSLTDQLTIPTGYHVIVNNGGSALIHISLNKTIDPELGNEGYRLLVTP